MSVYAVRFLRGDDETGQIHLLGFPLTLSARERTILFSLLRKHPLSSAELRRIASPSMTKNGLSVHVHNINKKAQAISGRKLILSADGVYDLNPTM